MLLLYHAAKACFTPIPIKNPKRQPLHHTAMLIKNPQAIPLHHTAKACFPPFPKAPMEALPHNAKACFPPLFISPSQTPASHCKGVFPACSQSIPKVLHCTVHPSKLNGRLHCCTARHVPIIFSKSCCHHYSTTTTTATTTTTTTTLSNTR